MSDGRLEKDTDVLRKILKRPHGEEALKAAIAEMAKKEQAQAAVIDRPIVAVLVPCYKAPHPRMQSKLLDMRRATEKAGAARVLGMPLIRNSVVHWQRNDLLSELVKSRQPFTHVLFIDDDIVPSEDALIRLLAHKVDIVAALCTFRVDPPLPNARFYDEKSFRYAELRDWDKDGLLEVDAAGTGMMLISRDALQRVADVWFSCKVEQAYYGMSDEKVTEWSKARTEQFDKTANAHWFQFLPTPDAGVTEYGEDISFCFKAKKFADLKVWVDTSIRPEHMGEYGFSVDDYLSQRRVHRERAQAEGRLVVTPNARELESADSVPMKISVLVPTRGRPENVKRLLESITATAAEAPEVVLYVDDDDPSMGLFEPNEALKIVRGPRICLSECWNECAKVATGDVLMHAGDDIVFKTQNWDRMVQNAFRSVPDRIIFAHGDDGLWGKKFGTHGFIHRKWMETVGYFVPPCFSSDYNDTHLNEVANALGRRVYLPLETEHFHPLIKGADGKPKAEWDQTHKERLERHKNDKMDELWQSKAGDRAADVEKLRRVIEESAGR